MNKDVILREPQIVEYLNDGYAIYALGKKTLLFHGLTLWCHLYNQDISHIVNLTKQDDNYLYFKAHVPLTDKTFSTNILSNNKGINEHGMATNKFIKYLNKRYKVLYTKDLFNVVENVTDNIHRPHIHSTTYYKKLRLKAMIENMKDGSLVIDFNYDPLATSDAPYHIKISPGELMLHYLYQFPFEQINKNSILYHLICTWMDLHHKSLPKVVKGFEEDNHFVYFGMTNIPHKKSWKFSHPNHYSDVDYFLLGGDGSGRAVKSFVNWTRTSSTARIKRQLQHNNSQGLSITKPQ